MKPLSLGYSPCPNDTFIFYALVHGKLPDAPPVDELLEDIETLNGLALKGQLDATKISFHALAHLRDRYCLLHAGGALGRGCGPLVVSRTPVAPGDLNASRVAIPGELTTAAMQVPLSYSLDQNAPNPFNPSTQITFTLPEPGPVHLVIYNLLGQEVHTLVEDRLPAGVHRVVWDGENDSGKQAASGIYLYRIDTNGLVQTRRMVLLK